MIIGHPFYGYDDDVNYYYSSPFSRNGYRHNDYQRRAMMEEAHRRAQLEKYYRMKQQEEREARRQEYLRRLRECEREEEAYRQAYADTIRRRNIMEENYRRNQLRQMGYLDDANHDDDYHQNTAADDVGITFGSPAAALSSIHPSPSTGKHLDNQNEENDNGFIGINSPKYKIVRGPGGRLYRVEIPAADHRLKAQRQYEKEVPPKKQVQHVVDAADVREAATMAAFREAQEMDKSGVDFGRVSSRVVPLTAATNTLPRTTPPESGIFPTPEYRQSNILPTEDLEKGERKKPSVEVEDVSDSEDEEDEFRSVWRNRHPSPGESWMEPIEGFTELKLH